MKTRIALTIPGEPQGKQRPRVSKFGTYTPKKTVNYETYIKELFAIKYPNFIPLEGPLKMELYIYVLIPSSASKKKIRLMENGELLPTKRPDVDNIEKLVFDALEKLAYKNDSQICRVTKIKDYSRRPRLEITILELA
jgi:Holliday junction resolvase RusA-like endonuclease